MKGDFIPATLRILGSLEFDSCLKHVKYNIEKLSEMLTNKENTHPFEVLNCIGSIITNIYRLMDAPTRQHDIDRTFCIQTRLESCHQEDIEKFKSELESIRQDEIYKRIKKSRNRTVAHTHTLYQRYEATQNALLEDAIYLVVERKDCLEKLVKDIESLIHHVEMSIKKKNGEPLSIGMFTIKITVDPYTVRVEVP